MLDIVPNRDVRRRNLATEAVDQLSPEMNEMGLHVVLDNDSSGRWIVLAGVKNGERCGIHKHPMPREKRTQVNKSTGAFQLPSNVVMLGVDSAIVVGRPQPQTEKEKDLLRRLSDVEEALLKVSKACEEISNAIDEYVNVAGP